MSRKSEPVTIEAEGRDAGKRFIITEMGAVPAERWARRAYGAMQKSGITIPDEVWAAGIATITAFGLGALLGAPDEDVEPLLAELMTCVKIVEPAIPAGRALTPDDIEEMTTILRLRDEVLRLHVGFSPVTAALVAIDAKIERASTAATIGNTSTSPPPSEPSSTPAKRRSKSAKNTTA